ncbi:MAG: HEAT repeat domain-containing protein [Geothrix sp.]|nr:HEAT repeat domain-containing protein [Geothrix sp.]
MSDFLPLAQSLTVALKVLQMYTATHPRSQESLAAAHANLERWLAEQERLQFIISGSKAFVDGQVQDPKNPHIGTLVRLIAERGVSGFNFERGVTPEELLAFLHGFVIKPAKLEEQGGFEALLQASGVTHIRVSQTRYQEVVAGEETGAGDKAPAFAPAPPAPAPKPSLKALQEALMAAMARGTARSSSGTSGSAAGASISGAGGGNESGSPGGMFEDGGLEDSGLGPADLSSLGSLAEDLGIGDGMPTPGQLGTLREALMSLTPEAQLSLLASLGSLPADPSGLALGMKALAGEILASATSALLAKGTSWVQLRGPIQDLLRPLADRDLMLRTLSAHLHVTGQDASQIPAILRHLEWEALSLEAKLLKVLEGGHLFELSLEQRLAFLRELLDLRRFDAFLSIQEVLLETLRGDLSDLRLKAIQTLAGLSRWAQAPGLPPGSEGPLSEALRAHFAWEPDPPIHRWTTEALETVLAAMIHRGEFGSVIADLQELEGLCAFMEEQQPWRTDALAKLQGALQRTDFLDLAIAQIFTMKREDMIQEVHPYLELLGDPMVRRLVVRLGEEADRTRRGRLVEVVRSVGSISVPALKDALTSPAWFLVRNALTLLSDIGDAGCIPAILPLLGHPEPRVRRTAVRALWKLGGPVAEPHLLAHMKETDAETMQEILFALGQLRSEGSLPQVTALAQDKRVLERLRIQALDTLGHIASPKALPILLECMRRKGLFNAGEPPAIRMAAAKALAALGTPEASAALQKAADSAPPGEERDTFRRLLDRSVAP